jgi:ERCC4-type nuclease
MERLAVEVDMYELKSRVPTELEQLGVTVRVQRLVAGDYDVGAGTIVERKTAIDLAVSLEHGRLWRQIARLRGRARFPVLLIEGRSPEALLGENAAKRLVIAIADQGVVVLNSSDSVDSARWIACLARRRQAHVPRDRPPYTYRGSTAKGRPGEALLCAIEGISVHHARLLLDTFGSVRRIVEANSEDWQSVRGIGPARAAAMSTCFDGRDMISLPPRQRRRARDRAT